MIFLIALISLFALYEVVMHFEAVVMYIVWFVVLCFVYATVEKHMIDTLPSFVLACIVVWLLSKIVQKGNSLWNVKS